MELQYASSTVESRDESGSPSSDLVQRAVPNAAVTSRRLQPFGLELRAATLGASVEDLDPSALRALVQRHGVLVLRGFASLPDKAELAAAAARFGDLLSWNFGQVLDLIVHENPQNYLFTREAVPYHWDGAFAAVTPSLQFFQCLKAPDRSAGGETLFCDTGRVLERASPAQRDAWQRVTVTYRTDKLAHYGGCVRKKLMDTHPHTGRSVLRFAEPVDTGLNPVELEFEGLMQETPSAFLKHFVPGLYAPEVVYAHPWQDGDFVVADNHALLHGRHAFAMDTARHLQRVHVL